MKNESKKGGKRAGSGRKPTSNKKEAITIYADISKFESKDAARLAIYEFLDGKNSFVELKSPQSKEVKTIINDLTKPTTVLEPKKQPKTNFTINTVQEPKNEANDILKRIEVIRSEVMPKERDTPIGRKSWLLDQQKRIQELQNKLK